jgi:uncharacterized protein (DUF302 family)
MAIFRPRRMPPEHEKFVGTGLASPVNLPSTVPKELERAMPIDGLTTIRSSFDPKETIYRLEAELEAKGMSVFARIDHAAGAAAVGLSLRPTEVLIFGNARGGTPLMQAAQSIGIDLPLKALVWQDASGATWLSYNDPVWLAKRHSLSGETEKVAGNLAAALHGLAQAATTAQA